MNAVTHDADNLELRTVRFYFKDRREAVLQILWEQGMAAGSAVIPGQKVATIIWRRSAPEDISAPAGCQGTVEKTNRRILYEKLRSESTTLVWFRRA